MAVLLAALVSLPFAARGQDSFARYEDRQTGAEVLGVLGTGLGLRFASLALEMPCPGAEAWVIELKGVRAPEGTPIRVGFADAAGRWTPIPVAPLRFGDRSLSLSLERNALRAALAEARANQPDGRDAELQVVVGDAVGLAVSRDLLVREMTAFARDCGPPRESRPRYAYAR